MNSSHIIIYDRINPFSTIREVRLRMSFCGYKYRFGLYAAHSNLINSEEHTHFHNFTITLYINTLSNQSDDNYRTEQVINDWLKQFQGQQLPQMELFYEREISIFYFFYKHYIN